MLIVILVLISGKHVLCYILRVICILLFTVLTASGHFFHLIFCRRIQWAFSTLPHGSGLWTRSWSWSLSLGKDQLILSCPLPVSLVPTLRMRPRMRMRSSWWRWNHRIASLSRELLLRLRARSRMRIGPSPHSLTDWAPLAGAVSPRFLFLIAISRLFWRREIPWAIFTICLIVSYRHGSSRTILVPVLILHVMTSCFCWWVMLDDCPIVIELLWNWHIIKYSIY